MSVPSPGSRIQRVVRLHEYYQDPNAPRAHDLLPAAFAAVRSATGEVLLVRRIDDGNWELPGGRIEVGETAQQAVIREVAEESGVTIKLTTLSGVYSDPSHVLVDPDGSIHQQLALCFHAVGYLTRTVRLHCRTSICQCPRIQAAISSGRPGAVRGR